MRRLAALGMLLLVLSGCSGTGSPKADLQTKVNDLVTAANGGNAADVRTAADLLLREIQAQSASATLTTTRAQALQNLVGRILVEAGLLEPVASPAPAPSTAAPSPTPTHTPSPTPTPTPSPSPTPLPPAPSTPPPSPGPVVVPSVVGSAPPPSGGTG